MVIQKPFSTANSEKNAFWFFLEDGACFAYISPWGGGMLSRESSHRGNSYYIAPLDFRQSMLLEIGSTVRCWTTQVGMTAIVSSSALI